MARRPPWDGQAAIGWHWLRRRRDGAEVMAFRDATWRVADAIGRTSVRDVAFVARHYELTRAVLPPSAEKRTYRRGRN